MECLLKLISPEEIKIKLHTASEIIKTIIIMCSTDILNAFDQIGYTPKDLVTAEKSSSFAKYAQQLAQLVIEMIFENKQEIEI